MLTRATTSARDKISPERPSLGWEQEENLVLTRAPTSARDEISPEEARLQEIRSPPSAHFNLGCKRGGLPRVDFS